MELATLVSNAGFSAGLDDGDPVGAAVVAGVAGVVGTRELGNVATGSARGCC